jgi:pimeloyl-ACP methyl ester carboxylesterase
MIDAIGQVSKSIATKPITKAADIVAWLDETLRALGIDRAAMVGLSMGSWMATQYALAFPDRVDRLALIAPAGLVSGLHLRFLLRVYRLAFRPSEADVESFFDTVVTPAGRRRLRQEPWRLIRQQCVVGVMGFKFALIGAVRPTRCDLRPLSSARIPVLAISGRMNRSTMGRRWQPVSASDCPRRASRSSTRPTTSFQLTNPRSWKSCWPTSCTDDPWHPGSQQVSPATS